MKSISFDRPPLNGEAIHQRIDGLIGVVRRMGGEMRVSAGCQNAAVPEDFLHLKQINASLNQVSGVTVTQAMRGNLFFIPQA